MMTVEINTDINVAQMRKINDQSKRPTVEFARLIRRMPCVGEFKNQVLHISRIVFSFLELSSVGVDIFSSLENHK